MKQRYVAAMAFAFLLVAGTISIFLQLGSSDEARASISYTWNGSVDASWSNAQNWTPNGVPSGPDVVSIPATCPRYPQLAAATSLASVSMATGTQLNLNIFNLSLSGNFTQNGTASVQLGTARLSIAGTSTINSGSITGGAGSQLLITGATTVFGNSSSGPIISTELSVTSSSILTRNTVYNGPVQFVKSGTVNDQSAGNNTFNSSLSISCSGPGFFLMSNSTRDIYNGQLSLTASGSGIIYMAHNGNNTQFNENVAVNSSGSGGIRIGASAGTSTLASGKTISVGPSGFSGGTLQLAYMNIADSNPFSISLSGTAVLALGPATQFNGDVTVNSPGLSLNGINCPGTSVFTKSGSSNDHGAGNNVFNGPVTINHAGTGFMTLSNSTRDIYNAPLTLNTSNTGILYLSHNGTNTQYNDNVILNSTGSGGIRIGNSNGTSTMAAGKTFSVGSTGFSAGTLQLGRINFAGTDPYNLALSGSALLQLGPSTVFNGPVTMSSPGLSLSGITCHAAADFTKSGSSNDHGAGNNTFNGHLTITHSGSGFMTVSNNTRDIYNGPLRLFSTGSGILYMTHNGSNTQFNDNVTVGSTAGAGGIRFGGSNGTSTFAPGRELLVDAAGFNGGLLQLSRISFSDLLTRNFNLGSAASIQFGPASVFTGEVSANAGGVLVSGAVFNRKVSLVKTGTFNDSGEGNNTFNDSLFVTNNGSGYLLFANSTRDIFNSYCSFTSNSGIVYVAHRGTDNQFNGNVEVNSTGNGVRFSTSSGNSILSSGLQLSIGSSGFSSGNLIIGRMRFDGSNPQQLNATGSAVLTLGPNLVANGRIRITFPGINFNGGTYHAPVEALKTGSMDNGGTGNNTFMDSLILGNSGSGYIVMSNTTRDIYNSKLLVNSLSGGIIYLAHEGNNTEFNDDVIFTSTGNGNIRIGVGGGTSTLASGKQLLSGAAGFLNGYLTLTRITLNGTTDRSINIGSGAYVNLGPQLNSQGPFRVNAGGIRLNGGSYQSVFTLNKTGVMNDDGSGNNVFNDSAVFVNNGSGYLLTSNTTFDTFNGEAVFTSNSTGLINIAHNDTATVFNSNIRVNSTSTGGVRFGAGNGLARIASGRTLAIGSNGFTGGELFLRRVIQLGNDPINLSVTSGNALINLSSGCDFNGTLNVNFPQVILNGINCDEEVVIEKNGSGNNTSNGGNTFNRAATIISSGPGSFTLANSSADDFNANVIFRQIGSGALLPANNAPCTFAGNLNIEGTAAAMLLANSGSGSVVFDGSGLQEFNRSGQAVVTIRRMTMNNTMGLRLNAPLNVSNALTLNTGVIRTSATNLLVLGSSVSSVSNASLLSYVDGPLRKTGSTAFTYPVGKAGQFRPLALASTVSSSDQFTAEYFGANPDPQWTVSNKASTLHTVSRCEYWTIVRNVGTANIRVTLSWLNPVSCGISNINDLRVARWDSSTSRWTDLGNNGVSGDVNNGTLQSLLPGASYGVFTLGSSSAANSLPVELLYFRAEGAEGKVECSWKTQSEKNNDHFTVQRSRDGENYESIGEIKGAGTTHLPREYSFTDQQALSGLSYYRLKQTDFDGKFEIFRPVPVELAGVSGTTLLIQQVSPNPFSSFVRINVQSPFSGMARYEVLNSSGIVVQSEELSLNEGKSEVELQIDAALPPGLYFLRLGNEKITAPLFKVMKK